MALEAMAVLYRAVIPCESHCSISTFVRSSSRILVSFAWWAAKSSGEWSPRLGSIFSNRRRGLSGVQQRWHWMRCLRSEGQSFLICRKRLPWILTLNSKFDLAVLKNSRTFPFILTTRAKWVAAESKAKKSLRVKIRNATVVESQEALIHLIFRVPSLGKSGMVGQVS
jgi:hypothetical protein